MILESVASATLANQDIGAGYVTAFSGTLSGDDNRNVIATTRITGRDGGSTVDISFRVTVGSLLKADETIEYIGTAGAGIELQSFPFRWGAGQVLSIEVQSSDPLDNDCGIAVLIEAEQGGGSVDPDGVKAAALQALTEYTAATAQNVDDAEAAILAAIGEIEVDNQAIAEATTTQIERTGGLLHSVKIIFDGIDKLIKWIRQ